MGFYLIYRFSSSTSHIFVDYLAAENRGLTWTPDLKYLLAEPLGAGPPGCLGLAVPLPSSQALVYTPRLREGMTPSGPHAFQSSKFNYEDSSLVFPAGRVYGSLPWKPVLTSAFSLPCSSSEGKVVAPPTQSELLRAQSRKHRSLGPGDAGRESHSSCCKGSVRNIFRTSLSTFCIDEDVQYGNHLPAT